MDGTRRPQIISRLPSIISECLSQLILRGAFLGAIALSSTEVGSLMTVKWRTAPEAPPISRFGVQLLKLSWLSEYQ
jgi:hypothetical protein